ncbi:MAG: iron-containing alcohol dehydrogenase, partial [Flavobacteriales bacterium]
MEIKKEIRLKESIKGQTANYKNFPMVPRVIYGRGSFDQLGALLMPIRKNADAPCIFLVDDIFEGTPLADRIPLIFNDQVIFISADEEPKTVQVDVLVANIKNGFTELPSAIIGIGGGTLLDLSKAVAIMLTNTGSASEYQGWDLVQQAAVYHLGIPTISGTGAEVSRTAVLLGPDKKLGINSDHTVFDQVLLDPDLTKGVSKEQWFYTGMDCFIHCIESLEGTYLNAFSQTYGEKALDLCKEVFLGNLSPLESREKLMMASWHGGMSIAYSQVGVAHALSYGLSYLLGVKHGIGNCLVFEHLQEFYPEGV